MKREVVGDSKGFHQEVTREVHAIHAAWLLSVTKADATKKVRIAEEKLCVPSEAVIPIKTLTEGASRCHV